MAVFRVERNKGYTVMSNHHLRNKELSLKAKGLLSQMLSLPEDWDYGIDFALKKDTTESPPRYLVFFKGRDADVLTAAFKEFSAKKLTQDRKPSIRKLLTSLKEAAQGRNAQREKVKNKDRGREL